MGETSVEDIRERMHKAQMEIKEQKEVSYDALPDNEHKVSTITFCTFILYSILVCDVVINILFNLRLLLTFVSKTTIEDGQKTYTFVCSYIHKPLN